MLGLEPPIDDWLEEEAVEPEMIEERLPQLADDDDGGEGSAESIRSAGAQVEKNILLQTARSLTGRSISPRSMRCAR